MEARYYESGERGEKEYPSTGIPNLRRSGSLLGLTFDKAFVSVLFFFSSRSIVPSQRN